MVALHPGVTMGSQCRIWSYLEVDQAQVMALGSTTVRHTGQVALQAAHHTEPCSGVIAGQGGRPREYAATPNTQQRQESSGRSQQHKHAHRETAAAEGGRPLSRSPAIHFPLSAHLLASQEARQGAWKVWAQGGRRCSRSPTSNGSRHTAQLARGGGEAKERGSGGIQNQMWQIQDTLQGNTISG